MRLLLDTHALLWYTLSDPQLSATAAASILDPANEILVSPASFWEIAIKTSIGKLTLHQPYQDYVDVCMNTYQFMVLSIELPHLVGVAALPYPTTHKDPFDRLLVAQALVENVPLISADPALDAYGLRRLW